MRYVIRFLFHFQLYVKNNCLAMSTFIHKISIGTESVILLCTYGCSLEGAKEVMFVEGRGEGIVAMEKVSIFYTVDLQNNV